MKTTKIIICFIAVLILVTLSGCTTNKNGRTITWKPFGDLQVNTYVYPDHGYHQPPIIYVDRSQYLVIGGRADIRVGNGYNGGYRHH